VQWRGTVEPAFESGSGPHYVRCKKLDLDREELTVIIILALVALFIGLRLYSVLGERTGHEQQPILKPADPDARVERPVHAVAPPPQAAADAGDLAYLPTAGPGVRAVLAADPSFDVAQFLDGAQAAYRMILEAFWSGELETVRPHVDDNVYEAFASSVKQRKAEGLVLDNRLVHIEQAVISAASLENSVAFLTVRFEADIAAVTRNKDGEVVAGSMSDAVQTRDLWTFRRNIASRDPNWLLVETDEEE
jgi:predicted lipid-binding transport protein (Tim44 family)